MRRLLYGLTALGVFLVVASVGLGAAAIWTDAEPMESHLVDSAALTFFVGLGLALGSFFVQALEEV